MGFMRHECLQKTQLKSSSFDLVPNNETNVEKFVGPTSQKF